MSLDIIEVLTNAPGQAGVFTVDTSGLVVDVPISNTGKSLVLQNGSGNKVFAKGDNFNILSIGCTLPYSFVQSQAISGISDEFSPIVQINYVKTGGGGAPIPGLSGGVSILPFANYEMSIGQNIDVSGITDSFHLVAFFNASGILRVSMIGVPTALNGKTFSVPVWVKVEHNNPLS